MVLDSGQTGSFVRGQHGWCAAFTSACRNRQAIRALAVSQAQNPNPIARATALRARLRNICAHHTAAINQNLADYPQASAGTPRAMLCSNAATVYCPCAHFRRSPFTLLLSDSL